MPLIYGIYNSINSRVYVGKTIWTLEERFKRHIADLRYDHWPSLLYDAMRKYGIENFWIELIEECDQFEVDDRERFWIHQLSTLAPIGYNLVAGGEGGDTSQTPGYKAYHERVLAEGLQRGANNAMYGSQGGMYGKKHSDETKRKMSESMKKKWAERRNG